MLAYYEAGKVVTNWFTEGADPVIKVSILPFSKSKAGYSHSIKDETALHTKPELLAKICCYLAGRCSEQHFKGYISTNGKEDL
jgi:ATP-dependent Zn protease